MDNRVFKQKNDESGTIGATISAAEVTTLTLSPVPENAPGLICLRPGTAFEEYIFYKKRDAGAGTVTGLIRDYTNLNGGVGREHTNGAAWETMQSIQPVNNLVDSITEGWRGESQTVAKVDGDTFTVEGNQTSFYTAGRFVRYNQDDTKIGMVISSSYSAGTGLTTVEVKGFTVPVLTSVEIANFQPKGFSSAMPMFYGEDAGASDTYAITVIPNLGAYFKGMTVLFKANTANTGPATLNVNGLGAITIKKLRDQDLETGDIEASHWVLVVYDGTNFQMISQVAQIRVSMETWDVLVDGATVTLDWSLSSKKILKSMAGNRTIAHSNIIAGKFIAFFVRQDGTGSRVPVWDETGNEVFAPAAVDTVNNKITVTEDVPTGTQIKFTTATTLPDGLTAGTLYYAINEDATHIKVATSLANARAGTAVDLIDQGTGNHTIHYYPKWDNGTPLTLSTGSHCMDKFVFEAYSTRIIGGSYAGQGEI